MRRRGARPLTVFIDAYTAQAPDTFWALHWPAERPERAHIVIAPDELVSSLDMRCVTALPVLVSGDDERRTRAIAAACMEAGAAHVVVGLCTDAAADVEVMRHA